MPRIKKYASQAERQKAYRERRGKGAPTPQSWDAARDEAVRLLRWIDTDVRRHMAEDPERVIQGDSGEDARTVLDLVGRAIQCAEAIP